MIKKEISEEFQEKATKERKKILGRKSQGRTRVMGDKYLVSVVN